MLPAWLVTASAAVAVLAVFVAVDRLRPAALVSEDPRMNRVMTELRFDDVPFDEALRQLRMAGGLEIHCTAAARAHIAAASPRVSMRFRSVKVRKVIVTLLQEARVAGAEVRLAWASPDGVLFCTDAEFDAAVIESEVWIGWLDEFAKAGAWEPVVAEGQLVSLVEDTVDPVSWQLPGRFVRLDGDVLRVRNSHANVATVHRLMNQLRPVNRSAVRGLGGVP
jgi:hypothetical protein